MSCHTCQNRPCTCPNANCGCPPDYSFNPATLTCEGGTPCQDTLPLSCIFSTTYLSCVKQPINTDLQTILTAMDQKICECGSCSGGTFQPLFLFYADSNNTQNGDGSVGNPFKTIDLVYSAVIGTGTVNAPQFPNATVYVMGGQYTTTQNIYIPGTNWTFFNGAQVIYTGDNYFIDSAVANNGAADFKVFGWISFQTTTGGFLRNSATYINSGTNKAIYIEAFKILGSTQNRSAPLINHVMSYGGTGNGRPFTTIKMQGLGATIASAQQHCIAYNGASCYIDLGGGFLYYGIDLINGTVTGGSAGNVVNYNCTDTVHPEFSRFYLRNGFIGSGFNTDMISVTGVFNFIRTENLYTVNLGTNVAKPNTYLNIFSTNTDAATGFGDFEFLLKDLYLDPSAFNTTNIILAQTKGFNYLEMQNCVLYSGCSVDFSSIILGGVAQGGSGKVAGYNIINGQVNMYNLPTSAAGLISGTIYKNGLVLQIA